MEDVQANGSVEENNDDAQEALPADGTEPKGSDDGPVEGETGGDVAMADADSKAVADGAGTAQS